MIAKRRLRLNDSGAAAIEMAFALPILLLFVFGIFQFGIILQANAGMQHALGEGARMATICLNPTTTGCTAPTDTAIQSKMSSSVFGMNVGTFNPPTVTTPATSQCSFCRDLQVSYTVTPNFVFFNGPTITLTRAKRVYLAH